MEPMQSWCFAVAAIDISAVLHKLRTPISVAYLYFSFGESAGVPIFWYRPLHGINDLFGPNGPEFEVASFDWRKNV